MRSSDMGLIRISLDFPIVWAFPASLFREGGVLANFQAFINVYKHYGPTAVDLDPRSKIQDYRKNFLDPRSGSKIQDPRLQKKLLGSKVWIQDPRSKITEKTSWIQGLDPRSKIQDYRKNFLDPRSGSKIQDPRFQEKLLGSTAKPGLGSGKALSSDPRSLIWNLGSRPWIREVFSVILDLGSWIQTLDPRSFFCNLGSWILDPDLGSKKFFLKSWILDPDQLLWIHSVYKRL